MKDFFINFWNSTFLKLFLIIIVIINFVISLRIWELYYPQATIVIHDYGHVFESVLDWKLWRLEHNKN